MTRTRPIALVLLTALLLPGLACGPEKPPAPDRPAAAAGGLPAQDAAPADAPVLAAEATDCVLTYAGERGQFADTNKPADVPEEARGLVRVTLLSGPEPPAGRVWVANLRAPGEGGGWQLSTVDRGLFEELALGTGRSSKVENLPELPPGLEPPPAAPEGGDVVVYKTDWCGVCKQLTAYLDRKGVKYVAKDIEKDPAAAAEMRAKAEKKGVKTGSVPIVDVRGELMVGFDRGRLEKLL
jgi:glutaredoxin